MIVSASFAIVVLQNARSRGICPIGIWWRDLYHNRSLSISAMKACGMSSIRAASAVIES